MDLTGWNNFSQFLTKTGLELLVASIALVLIISGGVLLFND